MNILAIDTSSSWGSVAVYKGNHISFISYLDIRITHSERLMLQIDNSLVQSELTLDDIDLIAFSNGPGSFTGLRIGLATVKGICTVKKIPLYPVNTLKALAFNVFGCERDIVPIIDAKMNEVYGAVFDKYFNIIREPENCSPELFIDEIEKPSIVLGDGVYRYKELLEKKGKILRIGLTHQNFVVASSLIGLVCYERIEPDYDFEAIAALEPYYLRSSQAELKKKNNVTESGKGKSGAGFSE